MENKNRKDVQGNSQNSPYRSGATLTSKKGISLFNVRLSPDLYALQRGFTLIELLVVVLIIGILAAVAVPQYEQAVMKSRYATLKANVKSIYEAQQLYFLANGKFAEDFEELSIDLAGCTLSEDKKQCIYPWGKCHFASGNGGVGRGVCQNTTTLKNAYVRHWQGGKSTQTCWAFTEDPNDKYGKLCEREGGVYDGSSTCTHAFGSVCQTYPITK